MLRPNIDFFISELQLRVLTIEFLLIKVRSIRESNHDSGVYKEHNVKYSNVCTKKLHFVSPTGIWKISSVACGFSSIKTDYYDYQESLISRINES